MPAARDEHHAGAQHEQHAQKRLDLHRHVEDFLHLVHDTFRIVHASVEDVEALQKGDGHQHKGQDKGQLDAAEDIEFQEIFHIGKGA